MNSNENLTHWKGVPLKDLSALELIQVVQSLHRDRVALIEERDELYRRTLNTQKSERMVLTY